MRYRLKRLAALSLTAAITSWCGFTALAGEWVDGYFGQVYQKEDCSAARNEWVQDKGSWYLTDTLGRKCIGWFLKDDNWYYLDATGARISGSTVNINGVEYTFDDRGAWIPDEASKAAGRVYRSPEYNMEVTLPWYFEMDMHSYLMPSFMDTREKYSFYVTFGDFIWNTPLEDAVESRKMKYEHNLLTIEKISNVTINNRAYVEILAYDNTSAQPWCYDEFYYYPDGPEDNKVAYFGFSYDPAENRKEEIASILSSAKPLE